MDKLLTVDTKYVECYGRTLIRSHYTLLADVTSLNGLVYEHISKNFGEAASLRP